MTARRQFGVIVIAVLGAVALIVSSGGLAVSARTRTIGSDRIVASQGLVDGESEICPVPGFTGAPPVLQQGANSAGVRGGSVVVPTRMGNIDKKPLHYIKDPNPAWSAIAVNAENDMVVMTDENLYRIVEYSRQVNTPPNGPVAEPRRVITGDNTKMEMLCGAYIDPKTLDVYVTNNDTQDWMPVFSREARGNAVPDRYVATPHRTWGIAGDETSNELLMTIQSPSAVIVYRKNTGTNDAPLRFLEGDATELADPHGIALDMKRNLMIISNHGHKRLYGGEAVSTLKVPWEQWVAPIDDLNSLPRRFLAGSGSFEMPSINIYPRGAGGNTAPIRVIKGPKTQLNWPGHVAVHEERGEIFVANDADDSVLVFREDASGDVAPIRVIKGPRTNIKFPTGLNLDAKNNEIWVANMGNFTATVFPVTASGDVAPKRVIRGGPANQLALMIGNPGAVGYDSKRQEILVPN
jgi:DNA-binding beta-propeller fold protein YncE